MRSAASSTNNNSGDDRINRVENGVADTYTYDAIDQITGVDYSTNRTVSYGYDALGSRTNVTDNSVPVSYTANNLNQYTAVGGSSLAYDAKGNLTTGPGSAGYTYDGNNRLTSATVGTNSATFTHDTRMRNIKRVVNGQTRYFYFAGWSLVQERDGSGNVVQNYFNGPRIDEIIRKTDSSGTVYYHVDALGSVVALTDHAGDVVERYTYDVFGAATVFDSSLTILTSSLQNNRFLFTGREWIEELELYDYRNRIYSPELGRFLQTDPIRFKAKDENLYRYCANNSVNTIDPLGLDFWNRLFNQWKTCEQLKKEIEDGQKEAKDKAKIALEKLDIVKAKAKDPCASAEERERAKQDYFAAQEEVYAANEKWGEASDEHSRRCGE